MPTTKERALSAAVEVLGGEGVRALSHARVDARAGLPAGSTSNWFRTRRSLLAGIVDWIAERERADFGHSGISISPGPDGLIAGLCEMVELETGPFAVRTRARYALFFELASDDELAAPLRRQRHEFERWTERVVTAAGLAESASAARTLMALADGLILHRLTVDPALDLRGIIERAVHGLTQPA